MSESAVERLAREIEASGLVAPDSSGVALASGGPDSACLVAGLARLLGAERVQAVNVDYGLREDSAADAAACAELCGRLGVRLHASRVTLEEGGNLQAAARDARYGLAEQLRERLGAEWIATGHTRTDLAETLLYRLAASPGRRALLGLAPRRGRVVRPLLGLTREETRELAVAAGLPFRDDPSNLDPAFARARIRSEVLPVLRELNPGAERNIAATRAELAEEGELLDELTARALEEAGAGAGLSVIRAEALAPMQPALRRLALRALAERAAGFELALPAARVREIVRLAATPEGGEVELGDGVRAICEGGMVRFAAARAEAPLPARLPLPGQCRFGRWQVRAELAAAASPALDPDTATLDADALGAELEVRGWRDGDRMRPLGLGGSKSLQDLFTDAKVPRSLRRSLPVVTSAGEIAWVAGVAVGEGFRLREDSERMASLSARVIDSTP
jgi:tRNA(Ile)-lysidine synthase